MQKVAQLVDDAANETELEKVRRECQRLRLDKEFLTWFIVALLTVLLAMVAATFGKVHA